MEKKQLLYLVRRFQKGVITDAELKALKEYQKDNRYDAFLEDVFDDLASADLTSTEASAEQSEQMFSGILLGAGLERMNNKASRKRYLHYWMAAAVLLLVGVVAILKQDHKSKNHVTPIALLQDKQAIKPGRSKAIIQLEDGSSIDLESLPADSVLHLDGYAIVKNEEGQLSYILQEEWGNMPVYNTIVTPKGGEYRLNLPDGTQIWVNASSKVKYPLNFAEFSRELELDGEAYFDVKNKAVGKNKLPFIVYSGKQKLEVLGTVFNVNNYNGNVQTTLLEGSVKLSFNGRENYFLKPDEQANYHEENNTVQIDKVDPFFTIAWKNEKFAFENASIYKVMESIGRWYDVEVIYEGDLSAVVFNGTISRYEDFNKLLNLIELTGQIKFEVSGRRVVVMK